MSTPAIVMMIVSIAIVWGGLALAVINLQRSDRALPDESELHRDL